MNPLVLLIPIALLTLWKFDIYRRNKMMIKSFDGYNKVLTDMKCGKKVEESEKG